MQLSFPAVDVSQTDEAGSAKNQFSGAFTANMKLPLHRWFRYSAGFSAEWVEGIVANSPSTEQLKILDPFCGSGTTLLAGAKLGAHAVGFEMHPFIARIARVKLNWNVEIKEFEERVSSVLRLARENLRSSPKTNSPLLRKCYTDETLCALEAIRDAYLFQCSKTDSVDELVWLLITSILRECSGVGTAQWQYILPNKKKSNVKEPFFAATERQKTMIMDLVFARNTFEGSAEVIQTDARRPDYTGCFDMVITSPPYPNNYDYADATRLEMTFWSEIGSWGDLQGAVRQFLVRSCSQHSSAERLVLQDLLEDEAIAPIRDELAIVCEELERVREDHGGRKTYHTMVAAYFADLARTWRALRELVREGGNVYFVIGDSAPYGVYVPCDRWLGQLAFANHFSEYSFDKFRDRNIKWKNRKHRVPLKEGVLHVKG